MAAYIHIAGRLGADPKTSYTQGGTKITNFNVAVNIRGNKGEDITNWYRVVVWGDKFGGLLQHLKKGSAVYVIGQHRPNQWTDKEGQQRTTEEVWASEVTFGPLPPTRQDNMPGGQAGYQAGGGQGGFQQGPQQPTQQQGFAPAPGAAQPMMGQGAGDEPIADDDLPFL